MVVVSIVVELNSMNLVVKLMKVFVVDTYLMTVVDKNLFVENFVAVGMEMINMMIFVYYLLNYLTCYMANQYKCFDLMRLLVEVNMDSKYNKRVL